MSSNPKPTKETRDLRALIDLTRSTQTLISHFQSSLSASATPKVPSENVATTSSSSTTVPNPLDVIKATTTLLRSHTTTLSLLLITPPLTPSALIQKIGDVSSGVLSGMVAAASGTPQPGQQDELGSVVRAELRAQVRRLLGTWSDVLVLVLRFSERKEGKPKDNGPTEAEKQDVLAATGVVWEACDALLKVCQDGVVGVVVKKAEEWRAVLLDAVEELKEWGEDVDDEDEAEGSDGEDDGFGDEDDIFGAANKLGKGDEELKELLDRSIKKLKMMGVLYQALIKRRLKTFPSSSPKSASGETNGDQSDINSGPTKRLDELMALLKSIPEKVDDLASSFYDLDEGEAKQNLEECCGEAKKAVVLVKKSWKGTEDEFTAWSEKWTGVLDAS